MKRARYRLHRALLELLQEKQWNEVTITDLCDKAKVNRSTFYYYYENLFELVQDIEDEKMEYDWNMIKGHAQDESLEDLLMEYLESIRQNYRLHQLYLACFPSIAGRSEYRAKIETSIVSYICEHEDVPAGSQEAHYTAGFYVGGILSVVRQWMETECAEKPVVICGILSKILTR